MDSDTSFQLYRRQVVSLQPDSDLKRVTLEAIASRLRSLVTADPLARSGVTVTGRSNG